MNQSVTQNKHKTINLIESITVMAFLYMSLSLVFYILLYSEIKAIMFIWLIFFYCFNLKHTGKQNQQEKIKKYLLGHMRSFLYMFLFFVVIQVFIFWINGFSLNKSYIMKAMSQGVFFSSFIYSNMLIAGVFYNDIKNNINNLKNTSLGFICDLVYFFNSSANLMRKIQQSIKYKNISKNIFFKSAKLIEKFLIESIELVFYQYEFDILNQDTHIQNIKIMDFTNSKLYLKLSVYISAFLLALILNYYLSELWCIVFMSLMILLITQLYYKRCLSPYDKRCVKGLVKI